MRLKKYTRCIALGLVLMQTLWGGEYRGQVVLSVPPPPADAAAATPAPAPAPAPTDKIAAPVTLPLPGATVTATQGDKKLTAVSDQKGTFTFADLPDGTWQLQIEMLGFSTVTREVATGTGLPGPTVELKMLPLDQIEAVAAPAVVVGPAPTTTMTAPAPATSAASPAPSLTAGKPATGKPAANGKNGAPAAGPATSFQRTDLSGSSSPAPTGAAEPAPEVTTELKQQAADGMLINGSQQNGAASPFAQNPAFGNNRKGGPRLYTYALTVNESNSGLNAAPFSLTGQNSPKQPTNNLQGTFSFGGPIKIPHLIERNGPRFQMNYTRIENHTSNIHTILMPDSTERTGDFSQELYKGNPVQIFDPQSGTPFANNIIPASRISRQAAALLPFFPAANFVGSSSYNYQEPTISNSHTDNFNMNISKNFLRRNLAGGNFSLSDTRSDSNSVFNFLDLTRSLGMNASSFLQRNFTNRFFGRLTFTFSRNSSQTFPFFANKQNVSGLAGITGNDQLPLDWGPPALAFSGSGIQQLSDSPPSINHSQTTGLSYLGTWNHGRHNIQFGGDFRWLQYNLFSQSNPRGTFSFTGLATGQVVNGVQTPGTGYDFADFLLGTPDLTAIAFGNADKYLRTKQPDLFIQDDWKVSPGLSLTLGLRYEYTSPPIEKYGRLVNLDVAPGYTAIAPVTALDPVGPLTGIHYPDSLIRPYRHEIEPLPGFAWRPFPASSMVIRGGYSLRYNTQVYQPFVQSMDQQSPFSTNLQVANSAAAPLTLANGFYAPPNKTTNTIAVDPNFKIGNAQNWQLSVQRDLPGSLVMLATYNGIKGTHLLQEFAPNTYPTGAPNPCPSCPNGYTYYTSGGNSEREAGSMQLRRRLHNGITAQGTYTYSKTIDDAAALGGGAGGGLAQNWLNLAAERGPSNIDQRHLLNAQWQYTSGVGVGGGALMTGWRGKVLKDWTVTNQINVGSGLPLTPTYPEQVAGINGSNVRASYTGASLYAAPSGLFLNPLAISAPASGQWGDAGRNSIRGPGQFSMSAQLARSFKLSDRFNLAVTLNANNPLNHVVFGAWNTLISSQLFGTATSPNAMRTVNLNMRLTF